MYYNRYKNINCWLKSINDSIESSHINKNIYESS